MPTSQDGEAENLQRLPKDDAARYLHGRRTQEHREKTEAKEDRAETAQAQLCEAQEETMTQRQEVNDFFDAVLQADRVVGLRRQRAEKVAQLNGLKNERCGNCSHWMKVECKPEHERGRFKSASSFACKDFAWDGGGGLVAVFEKEIAEIDALIEEAKTR